MDNKVVSMHSHNQPPSLPEQREVVRELSREQQFRWIERIFSRLLAIYGDKFAAMWSQADKNEMKLVWADALGGFSADEIGSAITKCYEAEWPPNLAQFVGYCRTSMRSSTPNSYNALSFKESVPNKEEAQQILERLKVANPWISRKDMAAGEKGEP